MSRFQDQLELATLLAFMVKETGKIEGRLRVQKMMYLLQQKGVPHLRPFFFEYHHYGPFSAEVADVIKGAVQSKIIRELEEHNNDGWKRFEYRPGQDIESYAGRVDPVTRKIVSGVLAKCKDAHWRTLELAATAHFLACADGLNENDAFREALERKPQCKHYEPQARDLLMALAL